MAATADFELSVTRALSHQLSAALATLTPVPLTESELGAIQNKAGVYVLRLDGQVVYIGKSSRSLRQRLGNHHRKLSGRRNLSLDRVTFSGLYMKEDLDAVAPETLLIKDVRPPWNFNGFGNKDPGKQRDKTVVRREHFDAMFPINLDAAVTDPLGTTLEDFLVALKRALPFNLRYTQDAPDRQVLQATKPPIVQPGATVREVFSGVVGSLPIGWQLTALPGYAILYAVNETYSSAQVYWRKTADSVLEREGEFRLADGPLGTGAEDDPEN